MTSYLSSAAHHQSASGAEAAWRWVSGTWRVPLGQLPHSLRQHWPPACAGQTTRAFYGCFQQEGRWRIPLQGQRPEGEGGVVMSHDLFSQSHDYCLREWGMWLWSITGIARALYNWDDDGGHTWGPRSLEVAVLPAACSSRLCSQ